MKKAKFECQECNYNWEGKPGPVVCPKCGHLYINWINYKEFLLKETK